MPKWQDAPVIEGKQPRWKSAPVVDDGPPAPMSLQERAQDVFGLDPTIQRGALLPLGRTEGGAGDLTFAVPQVGADALQSLLLPGHALKGGEFSTGDVARLAFDAQMLMRSPVGQTKRVTGARADRAAAMSAPSGEKLKAQSGALYKKAKAAGTVVAQPRLDTLADDIVKVADDFDYHPRLHPRIKVALDDLADMKGTAPDLGVLEKWRRVLKKAGDSVDAGERQLSQALGEKLDDFIDNLQPDDLAGGGPEAGKMLTEARSLWSRMRKGEELEELVTRAHTRAGQFTGSGFENALRTEFRQLILNRKRFRRFTEAEQAAIKRVAEGGRIGNLARAIGRFAVRGPVSGGLTGGIGAYVGQQLGIDSLATAAGAAVTGEAGRAIATSATLRNAARAVGTARAGAGPHPPVNVQRSMQEYITQQAGLPLAAALMPQGVGPTADTSGIVERLRRPGAFRPPRT